MRFNIYGRYQLEVVRQDNAWIVYRTGDGKRRREMGLVIPSSVMAADVPMYLDDLLHELASPGATIRRLD
ncbi:MAG TPA: hypothetical protein VGA60_05185 [Kiloniellales bacterium]|jgi:hypothetical protein